MKRKITIMTAIFWFLLPALASGGEGWQADIKVSLMDAENRLSIGQRPDATDGWDARYDVPALLSGEIMASIEEPEGGKYWRKFKSSCGRPLCAKNWDVLVESDAKGQVVSLNWNPSSFPPGMTIFLLDVATGDVVDMQAQAKYSYKNTGKRKFQVEVRN